jgi:hypothetical protein
MADIRVTTSSTNLTARVGQENAIKIISNSSGGGSFAGEAKNAQNVIGGIASVSQLNVSGISTFQGSSQFDSNVTFGDAVTFDGAVNFNSFDFSFAGGIDGGTY